jgi:hypothetical protein
VGNFIGWNWEVVEVLTERQEKLIRQLCGADDRLYIELGEKAIHGSPSASEIEKLCDVISNEFLMKGIREDFEPNEYGLELERLLDVLNRGRLHR